jgi:hypothetical protein
MRLCNECHPKANCKVGRTCVITKIRRARCEGCGEHAIVRDCHGYDLRQQPWYPKCRDNANWYPQ